MTKKTKTTVIYLYEKDLGNGATQFVQDLVGDKPTEQMAKKAIDLLLEYAGKIRRIE